MTKDKRPRFGWCANLDNEPQSVWEGNAFLIEPKPVVLIPLPKMTEKMKKLAREFVKGLWTEEGK